MAKTPSKFSLTALTHWWTTIGIYLDRAKKDEGRVAWVLKMIVKLWDHFGSSAS